MPVVSVIIPTYNRADTILLAVQSVLRQSFTDFELIVVDDCSSDDTVAVLDGLGEPRLRVLRHDTNRGVSAARNTGIRAAQGSLVAFQDSDDEWLPEKLARQVACMEAVGPEHVAAYCGMMIVGNVRSGANERTRVRYFPGPDTAVVSGDILPTLLVQSLISTQTLMVRRDPLLAVGGFDESLPALVDWDLMLRLARLGPTAFVDEPLVIQRFSPNSITRSTLKRLTARNRIIEKNADLLRDHPEIVAQHHVTLAGMSREVGRTADAFRHMGRALGLRPLRLRSWISAALLVARSMARQTSPEA